MREKGLKYFNRGLMQTFFKWIFQEMFIKSALGTNQLWGWFPKILVWQYQMGQSIQEWTKQNLWKTAFKKSEGLCSALSRPWPFEFFKGCLPKIVLGPFLNALTHLDMLDTKNRMPGEINSLPNKAFIGSFIDTI